MNLRYEDASNDPDNNISAGIYLCSECSFAITVFEDDHELPDCPCCENETYTLFCDVEYGPEMTL